MEREEKGFYHLDRESFDFVLSFKLYSMNLHSVKLLFIYLVMPAG